MTYDICFILFLNNYFTTIYRMAMLQSQLQGAGAWTSAAKLWLCLCRNILQILLWIRCYNGEDSS